MMIIFRIVLLFLPLVLVLYFLYWNYNRKMRGDDLADESTQKVKKILLMLLFLLVMFGVFLSVSDTNNYKRDTVYVPPHVVDGKVVPGYFKEKETEQEEGRVLKDRAPKENEEDNHGKVNSDTPSNPDDKDKNLWKN